MNIDPRTPRPSAIGPLSLTSHRERSVICAHCQQAHNPGFIWNFSDTVRICFTCYRAMGEEARSRYERQAGKSGAKPVERRPGVRRPRRPATRAMGLFAIFLAILAANTWFSDRPLTGQIVDLRLSASPATRPHTTPRL